MKLLKIQVISCYRSGTRCKKNFNICFSLKSNIIKWQIAIQHDLKKHSEGPEIELLINIFPLLVIEVHYCTHNYIIMMSEVVKIKYIL